MMPSDTLTLAAGTPVAGYVIEQLLGHGGMADVYLAKDLAEQRHVALKVLPADANADPRRRERLLFEGRVLRSLRHPNICTVYEVGEAGGLAFLAMEYVAGETLHDLAMRERLGVARVLEIAEQIAGALEEARRLEIVHRDLKGSNIMVLPSGDVKVLDFGLAKFAAATDQRLMNTVGRATEPGMVFGTAEFMSPEQALGRELDHRSDLFSLGVLLYELLAGRLPFGGRSKSKMETFWAIVNARPTPVAEFSPEVPEELSHLVARLLEKDPRMRYQTAHQLRGEIRDLRARLATRRRTQQSIRPWVTRLAGSALGIAAAVLITAGVQSLSAVADDAIDDTSILAASVWLGSDLMHDLKPLVAPAGSPSILWVGNDGTTVYGIRRRRGARTVWVTSPTEREPRVIAQQAGAALVGRRGLNVYFASSSAPGGIYRTSLGGSESVKLTDEPAEQLAMTADARTIVFSRPVAGGYALWAVPANGGTAYRLSAAVLTQSPLLSPDATRVAMARTDGVLVCDVPACTNEVVLPITTLVGWSPDGTSLTHTGAPGGANIWATRIADGSLRQITRFSSQLVTSIAWSADGRRVAVTRQRTLADLVLLAPIH